MAIARRLLALIVAGAASVAVAEAAPPAGVQSYEECMALARRTPEQGYEAALAWKSLGGGPAAEHCVASALSAMGHYEEAAVRFEELAQSVRAGAPEKAAILGQAAQAWMMANQPERALGVLNAAIGLDTKDAELFIDRSQAHAAKHDYAGALADLDQALALAPDDTDALVFRASARRYLGDLANARADVDRALVLEPANPEALLERGNLRRLAGDKTGARADWLRVVTENPDTAAARNAQHNIEELDVRAGKR